MADGLSLKVTGVEKTLRSLDAIGKGVKQRQIRNASAAAAGVLKPEAAKRAPVETNTLARSFIVKSKTRKDKETAYALVGANRAISVAVGRDAKTNKRKVLANYRTKKDGTINVSGVKKLDAAITAGTKTHTRKPSRYLHLVNEGTKRGVKGKRFMQAAVAAKGDAAAKRFEERLKKGLAEEVAKARTT